ncbi:MAG: hypothetical protein AAGH15_11540 [Myxococcota bacterium]
MPDAPPTPRRGLRRLAHVGALALLGCASGGGDVRETVATAADLPFDPYVHMPEDTVGLVRIDVRGFLEAQALVRIAGMVRELGGEEGAKAQESLELARTVEEVLMPLSRRLIEPEVEVDDPFEGVPEPTTDAERAAREAGMAELEQRREEAKDELRTREFTALIKTSSSLETFLRVAQESSDTPLPVPVRRTIAGHEVLIGADKFAATQLEDGWILTASPLRIEELLLGRARPPLMALPAWARAEDTASLEGAQLSVVGVVDPSLQDEITLPAAMAGIQIEGLAMALRVTDAIALRGRLMTTSPELMTEAAARLRTEMEEALKSPPVLMAAMAAGASPTFRATPLGGDLEVAFDVPAEMVSYGLGLLEEFVKGLQSSVEELGEGLVLPPDGTAPGGAPPAPPP